MPSILDACEKILKLEDDFFVPVRKLYLILKKSREFPNLTFGKLCELLSFDERFSFYLGTEHFRRLTKEEAKRLAEMGYYSGPKVILKEKRPGQDQFFLTLARKIDVVSKALKSTWGKKPEGDEYRRKTLETALEKTEELKNKVFKIYLAEKKGETKKWDQ